MNRMNILFHIFNKIPSEGIIHFFGPPGGGINTLLLQMTAFYAETNRVVYLDNERLFSAKRLNQVSSNPNVLKNVVIFPCSSTTEQLELIDDIEVLGFAETPKLQIIVSDIFRYRHYTEEGLQDLSILTHTLALLEDLSKKIQKPIIISNQVRGKGQRPYLESVIRRYARYHIHLDLTQLIFIDTGLCFDLQKTEKGFKILNSIHANSDNKLKKPYIRG